MESEPEWVSVGEWPSGLGRWPVTPEVAGSNPVAPAKISPARAGFFLFKCCVSLWDALESWHSTYLKPLIEQAMLIS